MKKIFCLILLLFFAMPAFAEITVPKDTKVKISLKRKKSQKTISDEYTLVAVIKEDVYVKGKKVFAVNDRAKINVSVNDKAKFLGKGGTLVLDGGYVTDTKKVKHNFKFYKEYKGENAPFIAKIIFFKKGQNVVLYPHDEFEVTTTESFKF